MNERNEEEKRRDNYLAELAALTLAVMAIPQDRKINIFSDSLSSIASINKPNPSEREFIRTPCRGWLISKS